MSGEWTAGRSRGSGISSGPPPRDHARRARRCRWAGGAVWVALLVPAAALGQAPSNPADSTATAPAAVADTVSDAELAATSAAPWVPERPVPEREAWEVAVGMPERVATLPLAALGAGARRAMRWLENSNLLDRFGGPPASAGVPRFGVSVGAPSLGPSTGFGLGTKLQVPISGALLTAELQGSTLDYTRTRVALRDGPATFQYFYDWRPRDLYFGDGMDSRKADKSTFAWRQQRFQLGLGYPWQRPGQKPPAWQIGGWVGPREIILRHGKHARSFEEVFPDEASILNQRQENFVYGARLAADTRAGVPHWSRGFQAEAKAERFDREIDWLSIRSGRTHAPQFTRLSFTGQTGFSFLRDPRTVRLAVGVVGTPAIGGDGPLLLPDLVSLGADEGLASLDLGRFRDRDALVHGRLSYVFPIAKYVELDLHTESGGVFPEMKAVRVSQFRESYGFSVRPRTETSLIGGIGAEWSPGVLVVRFRWRGVE